MKKNLFTLFSLIALILFVAAAAFVASALRPDEIDNGVSIQFIDTPAAFVGSNAGKATPTKAEIGIININEASVMELSRLPGIGEVLAGRIVDYREANGGFASVTDLLNVSGIGDKKLEAILDYIVVE